MITLTTEQAQQIEEALEDIVRVFKFETGTPVEALAVIREQKAKLEKQEPVAWRNKKTGEFCTKGFFVEHFDEWEPLYATPVTITTPDVCGEVCARAKLCYGCNKDLEEANAKYAEQAEQEPVAYLTEQQALEKLCNYINQNFKTQKEAAKSFEVTEGFLSMVLNGKKPITEAMAHRLSLTRQTVFLEHTLPANGENKPVAIYEGMTAVLKGEPSVKFLTDQLPDNTPLYAAPLAQQDTHATHVVRTKDLTDDEIYECYTSDAHENTPRSFARAVIAAYKEKNK